MPTLTIPIELELTPRSRAVMDAIYKAIGQQFKTDEAPNASAHTVGLQAGEHYAGVVLDESGQVKHHLVLMAAKPGKRLNWQDAMDWAVEVGGVLPTRQEQALLYANCKPHLKPEWHWSSETHADDASSAWCCHFYHGTQSYYHKSYAGCSVAVRRV